MADDILIEDEETVSEAKLFRLVWIEDSKQKVYDLTSHIEVPSYIMNRKPVYAEWKDADLVNRRTIHRYQVEGSFTLKFFSIEEYNEFILNYNKAVLSTHDGAVKAKAFLNNDYHSKVTHTIYVYMDFEAPDEMPLYSGGKPEGIKVSIKER